LPRKELFLITYMAETLVLLSLVLLLLLLRLLLN
jgi:F0F1-type ATP synthase membrane subunit c/vacuolar-type H+-ATPase subunit K